MKPNLIKLIKETGAHVTLTENERGKIRSLLREYAIMKPVREPSVLPKRTRYVVLTDKLFAYLRRPISIVTAVILTLVLFSGGIAYAAEGVLPGNVLYPIKTALIEPIQIALAASPEARASLQMKFAERRINEAAILANENRLGTTTEAALATNFMKNANNAITTITHERSQSPTAADLLATDFAAQLAAYENVLTLMNKHSHGSGATAHLQVAIQAQITLLANAQIKDTVQATSSQIRVWSVRNQENMQDLQDAVNAALRDSAAIIDTASSTLDSSSSASARDALANAAALAAQGQVLLTQHDQNGASRVFHDSLSATARLDVLTRAAAKLKIQTFATTTTASTTPNLNLEGSDVTRKTHVESPSSRKHGFRLGL